MTIYALLKQQSTGYSTFHGITSDEQAADIWCAGGNNNHYWLFEPFDDGSFSEVQSEPCTKIDDEQTD